MGLLHNSSDTFSVAARLVDRNKKYSYPIRTRQNVSKKLVR